MPPTLLIRQLFLAAMPLVMVVTSVPLAKGQGTTAPDDAAQGQDAARSTGVLVLRNGNILEGAIRRTGPHYHVEQAGSVLQVPADQVEMACGSLVEAYELRRQTRVGSSVDANFELARWCLKNNLLDQAAREVLDARTRDPGHPALRIMDMQIRLALEIEASRREQAASAAAGASTANDAAMTASTPATAMLTPSPEAQTQFVRSIQPMLVNSCATGGCHQPGAAQTMHLDRWALEGNGNPELIRRNLEAVLAQINATDPASSPLLVRARKAHGQRRVGVSRPLATYQAALLLNWLNLAAGIEPTPPSEEVTTPPVTPHVAAPATPGATVAEQIPAQQQAAAPAPTQFTPRDAFDPEIFNRQAAESANAEAAPADEAEALLTEEELAEIEAATEP